MKDSRLNKSKILRSVLIFTVLFLGTVYKAKADEKTVKIGIILPLSGQLANVGNAFKNACIMAKEDASVEAGNKLNFNYELVFEDDELKPPKVATLAQKLININKVNSLVSTWSYGGTVVSPITQRFKIPHFGVAWDPIVAVGEYNFLHLTPPEVFVAKVLDGFEKKGYKKIWAFGVQESGSIASIEELKKQAPKRGMEVVGESIGILGDQDFRTTLAKVSQKKVDVFYANLIAELNSFKKQASELKIETPIVPMTGLDANDDLSLFEGSWFVSDNFVSEDFINKYNQRFNSNQTYGIGNFYEIIRLLIWSYEQTDGSKIPTGETIISNLNNLTGFKSIYGSIDVSKDGIFKYPAKFMKVVNGKRVVVNDID